MVRIRAHFTAQQERIPILQVNPNINCDHQDLYVGQIIGLINPDTYETQTCNFQAYITAHSITKMSYLTNQPRLPINIDDFYINFLTLDSFSEGPLVLCNLIRQVVKIFEQQPKELSEIIVESCKLDVYKFQIPLSNERSESIFIINPEKVHSGISSLRDKALTRSLQGQQNQLSDKFIHNAYYLGTSSE